jgi:hypothetical protein
MKQEMTAKLLLLQLCCQSCATDMRDVSSYQLPAVLQKRRCNCSCKCLLPWLLQARCYAQQQLAAETLSPAAAGRADSRSQRLL